MQGRIIKGVGGFYTVVCGHEEVIAKAAGIFRNQKIKPLVGDLVDVEVLSDGSGMIRSVLPRKNRLIRPSVANVDQIALVFSAASPEPNMLELNRYLVTVGEEEIPVVLFVTKADLVDEEARKRIVDSFLHAPYQLFFVSSLTGDGVEEVGTVLENRTTVFSGPSGVGKSSLLNRLLGRTVMETGTLSKKIDRGKNTTRHTELFPIGEAGFLLDTPGFTQIELPGILPENLALSFGEMIEHVSKCRYPSCLHDKEQGCAVKEALEQGLVSRTRYASYIQILHEIKSNRRYG